MNKQTDGGMSMQTNEQVDEKTDGQTKGELVVGPHLKEV